MQHTAIFTISKGVKGYNIKSTQYSTYSQFEIPGFRIFQVMEDLADIFNNVLKIAILFEIG